MRFICFWRRLRWWGRANPACMYVSMHVCKWLGRADPTCTYVSIYVCMHVYPCICAYMHTLIPYKNKCIIPARGSSMTNTPPCSHVRMHICACICTHDHIKIHTYTDIVCVADAYACTCTCIRTYVHTLKPYKSTCIIPTRSACISSTPPWTRVCMHISICTYIFYTYTQTQNMQKQNASYLADAYALATRHCDHPSSTPCPCTCTFRFRSASSCSPWLRYRMSLWPFWPFLLLNGSRWREFGFEVCWTSRLKPLLEYVGTLLQCVWVCACHKIGCVYVGIIHMYVWVCAWMCICGNDTYVCVGLCMP
jgi:hypothetical protein